MTAARCPRCDRPLMTPELRTEAMRRHAANEPPFWTDAVCAMVGCQPIDWRARCLAAEAERNEAVNDRRLYYSQRLYLREAQDIARRALVEGLAECERLRVLNGDIIAALAIWVGPGDDLPTVIRRERKLAEQAIRSGAAREERERVVAWLRRDPTMWADTDLADAIERGDHTAHAPGKGGEG